MNKVGKRKVRSDKKRDVKPTIPIALKECIYRLSYITNTPVKDVAVNICEMGLSSNQVIDHLSQYFKRTVRLRNTVYIGDLENKACEKRYGSIECERITIRCTQLTYENISILSYALDATPTRATALLLEASVHHSDIVNHLVKVYLKGKVNDSRMLELKKVMNYINANNNYDEQVSWSAVLSYIYDEFKDSSTSVKEAVSNFVVNIWKEK